MREIASIETSSSPISGNSTETPSTTPSNRNSWFSDFRAKLNQFSAAEFFSNLGFSSKNNNQGENRKSSIRGISTTTAASRSVMNLNTQPMDDLRSPVTMTTNENYSNVGKNDGSFSEIASSVRHRSDEPRRRLFMTSNSVVEPKEDPEPIWRLRQQSEPPNLWSTAENGFGHGADHEDEEKPSQFSPGDYESATITLDKISGTDVVSACEIQRFGTLTGLVSTGKKDAGIGHVFEFSPAGYPTWCDKCGDFISGLIEGQAVICKCCRYTCHVQCQILVNLDCRSSTNSLKSENSSRSSNRRDVKLGGAGAEDNNVGEVHKRSEVDRVSMVETEATELADFEVEELVDGALDEIENELHLDWPKGERLSRLIDEYNKETADGLAMTLEDDGITFRGFLQIHMNFSRPISVVAGEHPTTIYDVLVSENDQETLSADAAYAEGRKTITSFYLPRNTVKVLHITSETTTSEMIVSLLKKFKVADNPRKFALYERDLEPGKTLQARLLRIPEEACPLRLALLWGCKRKTSRFVLQENESGDIMVSAGIIFMIPEGIYFSFPWDAFEIPELQNFLKILDIEENQYAKQIEQRYYVYRYWLEAEIRHRMAVRNSETARQAVNHGTAPSRGILDGLDDETAVEV